MGDDIPMAQRATRSMAKWLTTRLFDFGDAANRKVLWNYAIKRHVLADATACLRTLLPSAANLTEADLERYLTELVSYDPLRRSLERHKAFDRTPIPSLTEPLTAVTLFCYVLPRILKPATIVETGCATGWMSALCLLALQQNQKGHLYSIDLSPVRGQGSMEWTMPQGVEVGFLVPPELRDRWTLTLGNITTHLLPLLEQIKSVDLFCHDSDHTYVHMMWEYTSVWPYLAQNGVIVSDDIGWNTAFWDFATAVDRGPVLYRQNTNVGALPRSTTT